ncbi:hypothetical protein AJ79_02888 [Helicocarpus griseus UAMH5409]|uniref:Uncharacterized protein n=1 Tax=Helicocarpus griseus UAMH5409 TaxID=1447875 RepID=A0A2B7Y1I1_9EURO|nr:hypothetical protein AJ79_02888 [Helicocarpus griseus UAMH5409]
MGKCFKGTAFVSHRTPFLHVFLIRARNNPIPSRSIPRTRYSHINFIARRLQTILPSSYKLLPSQSIMDSSNNPSENCNANDKGKGKGKASPDAASNTGDQIQQGGNNQFNQSFRGDGTALNDNWQSGLTAEELMQQEMTDHMAMMQPSAYGTELTN